MAVAEISARGSLADSAARQILEARSDPRVAVDFPVELLGSDFLTPLPGHARDVGVGGLCVATRSMFSLKSVRRVVMHLPQGELKLAVEGRWQADSDSEDCFLTGIAFDEPEPTAVRMLWDLVNRASNELAQFLHQQAFLRCLGVDEAMGIAQISRLRRVPNYRCIYHQHRRTPGDDSLFFLRGGAVTLHHRFGEANDVTFATLAPGSVFGGLPFVADVPNLESATACGTSVLIELTRAAYTHLRLARPLLAHRLTEIAVRCHSEHVTNLLRLAARRL